MKRCNKYKKEDFENFLEKKTTKIHGNKAFL